MGRSVIGMGISYGLGKLRESILARYKEDIQATVRERIEELYGTEGFTAPLSAVLAFDGVSAQGWQVRARVNHDLKAWEQDRIGPVLSVIENGFKLISAYHDSVSLSVALEAMSFTGGLAAQYAALVEFLRGYTAEMQRLMEAASREQVQPIDGVLEMAVPGIEASKREAWIEGLQEGGILVGTACHRVTKDTSTSGWRLPETIDLRDVTRGSPSLEAALDQLRTEGLTEGEAVELYAQWQGVMKGVLRVTNRCLG